MKVSTLEYKTMIAREYEVPHEWHWNMTWWTGSPQRLDPDYFLYRLFRSKPEGAFNDTRFSNGAVDALLDAERETYDTERRREIIYEAQELVHEHQPSNIILNATVMNAYRSDNFKNPVPLPGEGYASFWNLLEIEPKKRQTLRAGYPGRIQTLNPFGQIFATDFRALRLIYDRLFVFDKNLKPTPWLAKSTEVVNDKEVKISIREGHKFHDGEPVTAEDVAFTVNYLKKWEAPYYASSLSYIKGADVVDENTVRLEFNKPFAPYKGFFLTRLFILPEHIWSKVPGGVDVEKPQDWTPEKWVGSGPFKFEAWEPGSKYVLSANQDHFHAPKIKGYVRLAYSNVSGIVRAMQSNELDLVTTHLKALEADKLAGNPNIEVGEFSNFGFYIINHDCAKKPTSDPQFRKALAHAIPKKKIIEQVFQGHAEKGASPIAPANQFWHNPDVKPYEYNLDKAREILKDAGYWWDDKGYIHYPPKS